MHVLSEGDLKLFYKQTKVLLEDIYEKVYFRYDSISEVDSELLDEVQDDISSYLREWYHY